MPARLRPHGPAPTGGPARARVRRLAVAPALRLPLLVGIAAVAGAVALGVTDPYRPGGHLVCPLLTFTGYPCPGCGAQRAVHDLVRWDVAGAWSANALVVLGVPPAVLGWLGWLRRGWAAATGGARLSPPRGGPRGAGGATSAVRRAYRAALPWVVLGAVGVFGVLRIVPGLAPALAP